MKKIRLGVALLLLMSVLSACTAGDTAHTYPADGHTHVYGNRYDVVTATCLEAGTVVRYCKICHEGVTEEAQIPADIAARAHAFSDTVVAPTEATEGYTARCCTLCGYTVDRAFVVPAKYALLSTDETLTVAPTGATGVIMSDTDTHILRYRVAQDAAVPADVACRLAVALTLADELTREGATVTPDTPISFGGGQFAAKRLFSAYITDDNGEALRALAVAVGGSEQGFVGLIAARLARLGVGAALQLNPFAPAENRATLGATAVLLARVLDEPLPMEYYRLAAENDFRLVAGRSPVLYLTSADGTLRVTALAEGEGVAFAAVLGAALPDNYEIALYSAS